jgi:hypothetical protein
MTHAQILKSPETAPSEFLILQCLVPHLHSEQRVQGDSVVRDVQEKIECRSVVCVPHLVEPWASLLDEKDKDIIVNPEKALCGRHAPDWSGADSLLIPEMNDKCDGNNRILLVVALSQHCNPLLGKTLAGDPDSMTLRNIRDSGLTSGFC